MFKKKEVEPTKYDEEINNDRMEINQLGLDAVVITKKIISYQKLNEVLGSEDNEVRDMIYVERKKLYSTINKRDRLVTKQNKMLKDKSSDRITTTNYVPFDCYTREYIAANIRRMIINEYRGRIV